MLQFASLDHLKIEVCEWQSQNDNLSTMPVGQDDLPFPLFFSENTVAASFAL